MTTSLTKSTKRTRALGLSGPVLAVALLAASCGGGKPFSEATSPTSSPAVTTSTPQARLLASVQRATDAKTTRLSLDVTTSGLGTVGDVTFSGTGVLDLTHRRLQMTLKNAGPGPSISIEMRMVDGTLYLNTGDGWISQAVATASSTETPVPSNYLDFLQGVSSDARIEGHESLHGVDTTRYAATLDLVRALSRIRDAAKRAVVKHALDQFGMAKVPARVWIDDAGRLRKLDMSIDLSHVAARLGVAPGSRPKIVESLELFDFGVPVDVQAPANATPAISPAVQKTEADLRNALTAEKVEYTDTQTYTADLAMLKQIEPSLDWGGKLSVVVGPDRGLADRAVCLSETADGVAYAVGDVASGPRAGTYLGRNGCPRVVDGLTVSALGPRS
ncbi:MAG: hypothetical protein JWM72_3862 [Actinomycetia bacterium]|nr:hypothetical protein [Actinomycetes bacterium]